MELTPKEKAYDIFFIIWQKLLNKTDEEMDSFKQNRIWEYHSEGSLSDIAISVAKINVDEIIESQPNVPFYPEQNLTASEYWYNVRNELNKI